MPSPTAIHDSDDNDTADVPERRTGLKGQKKATSSDGTPPPQRLSSTAARQRRDTLAEGSDASDTFSGALTKQHISSKIKQKPETLTKLPSPAPTEPQPPLSAGPSAKVTRQGEAWKQLWSKRKWEQENGGGNLRKRQATWMHKTARIRKEMKKQPLTRQHIQVPNMGGL